ncbi:MAG: cobalamin biosynthesis protein CbiX [Anaerolineales bacterium]|nr:cobalamin biosynthesis protein CbiX [Anaerolineales bacterium]
MTEQKIGLLLVNHGSHSKTWRQALLDLEASARDRILSSGTIQGVKTAHMEYTEPSIATQMKAFDQEGFSDVIVVPIFLTVSSHSADDIPTILGQKDDAQIIASLEAEKIERYLPSAKVHITPLLDFTDVLQKNVLRRSQALSKRPEQEGLVLIGYGDQDYDSEWTELFNKVAEYVKLNSGINDHSHGWCGHLVHYNPAETVAAINTILERKEQAIVIPVLVAYDEMFQKNIIGRGVEQIENHAEKILYNADAILPDPQIEDWVIKISHAYAKEISEAVIPA